MQPTEAHHRNIAGMTFASVYPHYVAKVEKKGRTREELHAVLTWITGFSDAEIAAQIERATRFPEFFEEATLHENADQVTGSICGYRIEDIENPLTRKVRILDKLVDELARGRALDRILR